eukprot:Rhum_TRINITY_DN13850_c2_g2::Rhum_TRINITY_DN13850_c2_g2_i1::g.65103::m.65103
MGVHEAVDADDYYAVLDVSSAATSDEVKRAFHRLALESHPDKVRARAGLDAASAVQKGEERFKRIKKAYDVLGDPRRRQKYDLWLVHEWEQQEQQRASDGNCSPLSSSSRSWQPSPRHSPSAPPAPGTPCGAPPAPPHASAAAAAAAVQQRCGPCRAQQAALGVLMLLAGTLLVTPEVSLAARAHLSRRTSGSPGSAGHAGAAAAAAAGGGASDAAQRAPTAGASAWDTAMLLRPTVMLRGACPNAAPFVDGEYVAIGTENGRPCYRNRVSRSLLYYDSSCGSVPARGWYVRSSLAREASEGALLCGTPDRVARVVWGESGLPSGAHEWDMMCADQSSEPLSALVSKAKNLVVQTHTVTATSQR